MNRKLIVIGTLAGVLSLGGCAGFSEQDQRVGTGAAIGGLAAGVITGEWGWAVAGAAAGAATGLLINEQKERERRAFEDGVRQGQQQRK